MTTSSNDHHSVIAILRKTLRRYLTDHHSTTAPTTGTAATTTGSGSKTAGGFKPAENAGAAGLVIPWSTVLPFGSRALNGELPGGDLDCVMFVQAGVGFDMFSTFADLYLPQAGFRVKAKVVNARVPLIKTVYEGMETDILAVELATPSTPTRERLISPVEIFDKCTVASRPSINGRRTVMLIQHLLPFPETIFGRVLKAVKLWLKAREIYGTVFTYPGGVGVAVLVAKACIDHFQCLAREFLLGKSSGISGSSSSTTVAAAAAVVSGGDGGGSGGHQKESQEEVLGKLEDFQEAALAAAISYVSPNVGEEGGGSTFSEDGNRLTRQGCRNLRDVYRVLILARRSIVGGSRRQRRQKAAASPVLTTGRRAFEQVLGVKRRDDDANNDGNPDDEVGNTGGGSKFSSSSEISESMHPIAYSEEILVDGLLTHFFRFTGRYFKRLKSNQGGSIPVPGAGKKNRSGGTISPQPSGSGFLEEEEGGGAIEPIYITEDYLPKVDPYTGAAVRIQNMPDCWGQARSNYLEELVILNPAYPYVNTTYGVGSSSLDAWKYEVEQAADKVEERWMWMVDLEPTFTSTTTTTGGGEQHHDEEDGRNKQIGNGAARAGVIRLIPSLLEEYRYRKKDFGNNGDDGRHGQSKIIVRAKESTYLLLANLERGEFLKSAAEELAAPKNMFCGDSFKVLGLDVSFRRCPVLSGLASSSPIRAEMLDQRICEFLGYVESKLKFFIHSSESGLFQISSRTTADLRFRVWPGRFDEVLPSSLLQSPDHTSRMAGVKFFFILHGSAFSSLRSKDESSTIAAAVETILQQAIEEFTAAVELGLSGGGNDSAIAAASASIGGAGTTPTSLTDAKKIYSHLFSLMKISCEYCQKEDLLSKVVLGGGGSGSSSGASMSEGPVSRQKRGRE